MSPIVSLDFLGGGLNFSFLGDMGIKDVLDSHLLDTLIAVAIFYIAKMLLRLKTFAKHRTEKI